MPVDADDRPAPSSTSVTDTSTSFVARRTVARRAPASMLEPDRRALAIRQHAPHHPDELRVLVSGADGHAQRARDHVAEVADQHAAVGERAPPARAVAPRAAQDGGRLGAGYTDAGHAL